MGLVAGDFSGPIRQHSNHTLRKGRIKNIEHFASFRTSDCIHFTRVSV